MVVVVLPAKARRRKSKGDNSPRSASAQWAARRDSRSLGERSSPAARGSQRSAPWGTLSSLHPACAAHVRGVLAARRALPAGAWRPLLHGSRRLDREGWARWRRLRARGDDGRSAHPPSGVIRFSGLRDRGRRARSSTGHSACTIACGMVHPRRRAEPRRRFTLRRRRVASSRCRS